ncbi:type II toxin-antitoxin system RelE/ParE family toxin [Pseudomonas sp. SZMC_28357]|uniref:type II toxin-antitoxin system RelE/ParE family toxin n=1 Tax=Pseudomonas sp. SZMC_28357 TaxID=3074380 RepID=UPI002870F9F6|nr:type II toxin-antitoxin system RelE/ParE family toxin [Pseudomonas sp. SZMC_28357]MDR9753495.1 type II toxin-antitoxin system RelE/ParE family toxin [Pseudomonas sp. SZMC_28357]
MTKTYKVEFATAAEHGFIAMEHYLAQQYGARKAAQLVDQLVLQTITTLSEHAHSFPICQQAASLGVTHFHEYLPMGQRVLYEVFPNENLVVVVLVIGQRQSVEKQFLDYCLSL